MVRVGNAIGALEVLEKTGDGNGMAATSAGNGGWAHWLPVLAAERQLSAAFVQIRWRRRFCLQTGSASPYTKSEFYWCSVLGIRRRKEAF